jgi:cytochrome c biogenesis protein CcmG/thiol:disulfide interchange protein DsbE
MSAVGEKGRRGRVRPILLVPLALFAVLAAVFLMRLESGRAPNVLPSALVGHPAPAFELPPLDGTDLPGFERADLDGRVTLVNVFASWCVPCRAEAPVLEKLAKDERFRLVGINYKDTTANANRFLGDFGNPYAAIGVDAKGRSAIDWGVYGVPETFVVGADGIIRYKYVGPLSDEAVAKTLMPEIYKALGNQAGG